MQFAAVGIFIEVAERMALALRSIDHTVEGVWRMTGASTTAFYTDWKIEKISGCRQAHKRRFPNDEIRETQPGQFILFVRSTLFLLLSEIK